MRIILFFMLSCLFIVSCKERVIEARSITIKFSEPIPPDSWIEIDGTVLYHFANDTLSDDSKNVLGQDILVPQSLVAENPEYIFLSASKIYNWSKSSNSWLMIEVSNAEMAATYVASINEWQVKLTQSFDILDRIYLFPNNQFELFKGEVTLKRADDQPMRIKTSPNYPALIYTNEQD